MLGARRAYVADPKKKMIFIAGCGRSGTTLTQNLMQCFRDVYVEEEREQQYLHFYDIQTDLDTIVVKRTYKCYRSLHTLPSDIELVYCLRHPFDVLTSTHEDTQHIRGFHIHPNRWIGEYMALLRLASMQAKRSTFFSRYEDLIKNPDNVMERLANRFDLKPAHKFSENPMKQPIHARSIGKWRSNSELEAYLWSLPQDFRHTLRHYCRQFGYVLPEGYVAS